LRSDVHCQPQVARRVDPGPTRLQAVTMNVHRRGRSLETSVIKL
jgi:hypothetical protein